MRLRPGMAWNSVRAAVLGLIVVAGSGRASAEEGLPRSRLGLPTAPILLLTRPDVRQELGFSPELTAEAGRVIEGFQEQGRNLRRVNPEEAAAGRKAIDEASVAWITQNLSIAQRDRLIQLSLQWEGPSALITRARVAESLGLTREQRHQIRRAIDERNRVRGNGPPDPDAERKLATTTLGVLDQDQRERWHELLGPPFEQFGPRSVATAPAPVRH